MIDVAERRSGAVRLHERGQRLLELAAAAAHDRAQVRILAQDQVGMDADVRQHRRPELRDVRIHDGDRHDAGMRELEDFLVLEMLVGKRDLHRRLACRLQPGIERGETLVVAARAPHENLAAGKGFHRTRVRARSLPSPRSRSW